MSTSELKAKAIGGSEGSHPGYDLGLGKHFVNVSETKQGQLNDPWLLNFQLPSCTSLSFILARQKIDPKSLGVLHILVHHENMPLS